jgi:hypothetical protein
VTKECGWLGARIGPDGEEVDSVVYASADDEICISKEAQGVRSMLEVLKRFVDLSRMEVNVKKWTTVSFLRERKRHRCSLLENLEFKGDGQKYSRKG